VRDKPRIIWITWEIQRRTTELSAALNVPLFQYLSSSEYLMRFLVLSARTILKLFIDRPEIVIVQNPSMSLTAVTCLLKRFMCFSLVVDRHSNFKFDTMGLRSLKYKAFHFLSKYTVRKTDLTIITNKFLKELVGTWGGRGFVLPDKLPRLSLAEKRPLAGENNIVFVCTYSADEPIDEVIKAAHLIDSSIVIHITGDYWKLEKRHIAEAPGNVVFTGFLDEKDYQSLLYSCDVVMVLTTNDHTLVCGAYEAVSLGKPLILSNKEALLNYFNKGVVFTENTGESIANAICTAIDQAAALKDEIVKLGTELEDSWNLQFYGLKKLLEKIP
jgi:glycosyltransferase involved in cell wall biosynthesis